jgi:hypothetical protein
MHPVAYLERLERNKTGYYILPTKTRWNALRALWCEFYEEHRKAIEKNGDDEEDVIATFSDSILLCQLWSEKLLLNPDALKGNPETKKFLEEFCADVAKYKIPTNAIYIFVLPVNFPGFFNSRVDYVTECLMQAWRACSVECFYRNFGWLVFASRLSCEAMNDLRLLGLRVFDELLDREYGQSSLQADEIFQRYTTVEPFVLDFLKPYVRDGKRKSLIRYPDRFRTKLGSFCHARDKRHTKEIQNTIAEVRQFWLVHRQIDPEQDYRQFTDADLFVQRSHLDDLIQAVPRLSKVWARRVAKLEPEKKKLLVDRLQQLIHRDQHIELEAEKNERELKKQRRMQTRARLEKFQNLLAQRCRQLVKVFNGLNDLEIDDEAVLNGDELGAFASIHRSRSGGVRLEQRLVLRMEKHYLGDDRTWLEIDAKDDEEEMRATIESANLLVWHELCHLADPRAVKQFMNSVTLPKVHDDDTAARQAMEVIIDGLGMNMGMSFYVHPNPGEPIPRRDTERHAKMYESHAAMARRIVAYLGEKELSPAECAFVTRFIAELDVHIANGSKPARKAQGKMLSTFGEKLGAYQALREAYAALYIKVLFWPGIASLKFYSSLIEMDEDEAEFIGESATVH